MPTPETEPISENKEKLDETKGSKISLKSTAHKAQMSETESIPKRDSSLSVSKDPKIVVQSPVNAENNDLMKISVDYSGPSESQVKPEKLSKKQQKRLEKHKCKELLKQKKIQDNPQEEQQNQKETKIDRNDLPKSDWRYAKLPSSFEYLESFEKAEQIYHDSKAKSSLWNVNATIAMGKFNDQIDKCLDGLNHNITKILIDYSVYIVGKINDCLSKKITNEKEQGDIFDQGFVDLQTSRFYSNYSHRFIEEFHQLDGLKPIFSILSNQDLITAYIALSNPQTKKKKKYTDLNRIIRNSLGLLFNLCRGFNNNSNKWKELNSSQILLDLLEKIGGLEDNQITLTMLIASIISDEEIDKYPQIKKAIPQIANIIGRISIAIRENKYSEKTVDRVSLEYDKKEMFICRAYGSRAWNLLELLDSLYNMAVNDSVKYEIYATHKIGAFLRDIIFGGNEFEVEYALKLLWQLCFDKRVLELVVKDTELYEKIKAISVSETTYKECKKTCQGIMWLNKKVTQPDVESQKKKKKEDEEVVKKHLMISYNKWSRDLCIEIKRTLEAGGYKVWIDVESIHGSSLESMANAVEDSAGVLMCMTENYKQSSNCRAEAEYAFQLGKPIIPLIMQKGYRADGWLGIILGSKIFIDFTKYEFTECIDRLYKEIDPLYSVKRLVTSKETTARVHEKVTQVQQPRTSKKSCVEEILTWTEDRVNKWLAEKEVNANIVENIRPADGVLLHQYYEIQVTCPEFFYNSISSNKQVRFRDVAQFSCELKKLFTES